MTDIAPTALQDFIRSRDLTYEGMAVLARCETSTISRIVRGHQRPRPQTIVALARALGISPKRLEAMTDAAWAAVHPGERVSS